MSNRTIAHLARTEDRRHWRKLWRKFKRQPMAALELAFWCLVIAALAGATTWFAVIAMGSMPWVVF